ncbi:PLP-dependent aminotransferase family protein [Adonisia turfae]|uniref:PLP-dependent aminotransferase family protein n=1 Tax=Adonisia turfae CCMR0081 TaxID=2292702 RepID=A0A6M0RY41_9CYAN|nr:PLP-dependent aminotransferase family protein [Adonisia turfae]NEZ60830.1 PLP-dependent aminotransferase family protein [Adonisia turfae CCMR0081]
MLHLQLDRQRSHHPYYLQIMEQIRGAILAGHVSRGFQLPPSRQLAIELGIARRTVVLAYEELCAQGYCESQVGKGTSVADVALLHVAPLEHRTTTGLPQWLVGKTPRSAVPEGEWQPTLNDKSISPQQSLICFTPSLAQTNLLPLKAMQKAFQTVMQTASIHLQGYEKNNGHPELLDAICHHVLSNRGITTSPNQILITNGSLHSSYLLAELFTPHGGGLSYGVPGYLPISRNFIKKGIQGIPCAVDTDGICLTEAAHLARFHYVMPEHHFPTGVTLSPERRGLLLQLASQQDALIIEDDYDSEFYFNRHPLPALKAAEYNERVIYLGTFSKTLFNGLRVGYIIAHPEIIQQLMDLRWQMDGGTSLILQLWLAELLKSGTIDHHLRRMRVHHRKKRDLIAQYLHRDFPHWQWQPPTGGLQFWIKLPPEQSALKVVQQCRALGVNVFSGHHYYSSECKQERDHLILGFGTVTEQQIHQAFSQLKNLP